MAFATYVAIGINLAAAAIAWTIARAAPHRVAVTASSTERGRVPGSVPVYVSIALSGFCALSAELVWTRNLSLLMGGTVYTFSVILAVFLAGLGIGSTIGSSVSGSIRHGDSARARVLLAACQLFQAAAIVWAAIGIGAILPYWPIDGTLTVSSAINLHMDVMRAAAALLPAAILWGASFPFALAAVSLPGEDAGRTVGRVYAANTIGAILGSLITALLLIPALGTTQTQQLLTAVTMVSALAATLPGIVPASRAAWQGGRTALYAAGLVFVVLLGNWLVRQVPGLPWPLVAYGRQIPFTSIDGVQPLYIGEGLHSSVGVTETAQGVRSFHVAGKTEASTLAKDMRLQRMLGHIPALFHPEPKSVLVVGLGAGVTAGSFLTHPSVERIVVCEIEPLVPQQIAPYFRDQNYDIVNDPRVEIVYDDARHYIRTTQEKFDVITSDPIHPWVKGAATLYTAEYFQMVKQRLKPGGVVTQWVPFYESSAEVVASELATFFDAFPEGTIWGNDDKGSGYDVVMFGQTGPLRIDVDQIERRLQVAPVRESLEEVNLDSIAQLMMTYAGRGRDLGEILGDAVINRDRTLRLQYMAGLQVNSSEGRRMYLPLLDSRQFPADLLIGSEQSLDALSVQMGLPRTTSP
jgi:spermidine synthase